MARRYGVAIIWAISGAMLLMAMLLRVRPDLGVAVSLPMFWIKVGFVVSLAGTSLLAASRLSRPGAQVDRALKAIAIPVVIMWAIATFVLFDAVPAHREKLFFGETWASCPLLITMLSVPGFISVMWAVKGLAPTQPRLAGFAAGLSAGATAALVYCLHCPEIGAPFVAFWYLLGMLIPAVAGAWLGSSLLRW